MARENYSKKRAAILDTLRSTKVHPTADWVYEQLKPQYSRLSLGTVYRNLKLFCADNKAKSIGVIDGQEHFDGDTSPHSHFVCIECKKVMDFDTVYFSNAQLREISAKFGVTITDEDTLFRGYCKDCLKKTNIN